MRKVITYGTFDLLHHGHINLLKRAKALGDYLIVGITDEEFDRSRGKYNVVMSLSERIDKVKQLGIADEIIIESYEGQKIDDIFRYEIDIFCVGSDWESHFDYLKDYCQVVYLERTEGISSSDIRSREVVKLGIVGSHSLQLEKVIMESTYVNGLRLCAYYGDSFNNLPFMENVDNCQDYQQLLSVVDAVYIASHPIEHYEHIKQAIENKVNVLVEWPLTLHISEVEELYRLAKEQQVYLLSVNKLFFSPAFRRMKSIIKSNMIGKVISVDATSTSLTKLHSYHIGSLVDWGGYGLLAIFEILGFDYKDLSFDVMEADGIDVFMRLSFRYLDSVADLKIANGFKGDGQLMIMGQKGYIYVPAPFWKLDYFEVRFEDLSQTKRYFFPLDGEGLRLMLVEFVHGCFNVKRRHQLFDFDLYCARIIEKYNRGEKVWNI